jgi:hypothetical protein
LEKSAVSLELFSNSGQQKPIAALFFGCGCSSMPSSRLALGSRRLGLSEIPFGKRSNRTDSIGALPRFVAIDCHT